mgnify:CR=1 FL=1
MEGYDEYYDDVEYNYEEEENDGEQEEGLKVT